ncbi:MAG: hypothetical protein OK452_09100 [Thaumarchaeota archaeon]|nr:hypothetical protein [Nitrososphaerota archaeon]
MIGSDVAPGSRSKVSKANPRSTSLSTVVPRGIVEQLTLTPGDFLDWDVQGTQRDKVVVVRKVKNP